MIYLIRHTEPNIAKGICYGQSDIDVVESFEQEALIVKNALPTTIQYVYSSPLQRCSKLASYIFPEHNIQFDEKLMELNCGQWELQHWDDIPKTEIEPWFDDYVNVAIPNGESYTMLYDRVSTTFQQIAQQHQHESVAIVAHGGVLRSILSYITNTPLVDSFDAFKIHYGAVIAIQPADDKFSFEILSNIAGKTEQHQPSNM